MFRNNYFALVMLCLLVPLMSFSSCTRKVPLASYVDPFVGTAYVGHTHPSAMLPFGMVQVGPNNLIDTRTRQWDFCSGYNDKSDSLVGFAHTHLSGTGCPDMGDILFMPVTGDVPFTYIGGETYGSHFSHDSEEAHPGFYKVHLDDYDVDVELTATTRAGFHKYIFPKSDASGVMVDLEYGTCDATTASFIKIVDDMTLEGMRRSKGFIRDHVYYFSATFSKPFEKVETFRDGVTGAGADVEGTVTKAIVRFKTKRAEKVLVKVGISTVSCEGARKNREAEIPGWNFGKVRRDAEKVWNGYLSRIDIDPLNQRDLKAFYTSLYHALIMPNKITDVDGAYRGWDHKVHVSDRGDMYTNFSLWDTYRAEHPFLELFYPEINSALVQSLLEKYTQTGLLVTNEYGQCETWSMIGNHAVDVIVDAYLKGDRSFDPEYAYQAIKRSMTKPHKKSDWDVYEKYGYFPWNGSSKESVSRLMEACYDDWCVAQMAKALGKTEDYERFTKRADNWKNVFDPQTGFVRPRGVDGSWIEGFDPYALISDPVTRRRDYTEGNAWQWTWHVQHKPEDLLEAFGSDEAFVTKLDTLFFSDPGKLPGHEQVADVTGMVGIYAHGNEPSHHVAYLYNYAGRPDRTAKIVRKIFDEFYIPQRDGLCGNDDCGQMSSWYMFSALGFYPVCPVSGEYIFGAPQLKGATLQLPGGKTLQIKANGLSDKAMYVKSIRLNGEDIGLHAITYDQVTGGGVLEYEMTEDAGIK